MSARSKFQQLLHSFIRPLRQPTAGPLTRDPSRRPHRQPRSSRSWPPPRQPSSNSPQPAAARQVLEEDRPPRPPYRRNHHGRSPRCSTRARWRPSSRPEPRHARRRRPLCSCSHPTNPDASPTRKGGCRSWRRQHEHASATGSSSLRSSCSLRSPTCWSGSSTSPRPNCILLACFFPAARLRPE